MIKGAKKWAELLVPVLSDIKISWNGATKETHEKIMIDSKWENVTENLKTFLNVRDNYFNNTGKTCSVTLHLTFLETNLPEIYDLTKMAIELGIDRIKGHHLWAHFEEIKHFMESLEILQEQGIPYSFIRIGEDTDDIEHKMNYTDDMPDEIYSFEPVVDVNDDDWSNYEDVDKEV